MKNIQKFLAVFVTITFATGTVSFSQGNVSGMSDTAFIHKNINDNIMEIQMSETGRDSGSPAVKKIARQMISDHSQMLADLRKIAGKKGMKDVFADPGSGNSVAVTGTPDTTTEANGTGITGSKVAVESGATGTTGTTSITAGNSSTTRAGSTGNSGSANGSSGNSNSASGMGSSSARGTTGGGMAGMKSSSNQNFDKTWNDQMIAAHQAKLTELETAAKQITDPELLAVVNKAIPKVRMHLEMLLRTFVGSK